MTRERLAAPSLELKATVDGLIEALQRWKIQAGNRVWHLNFNEPAVQTYTPGPGLVPGVWFEYEVVVQGNDYTVFLINTQTGVRQQTTSFHNTDGERGRAPGFIGVQAYAGNIVAWRHIRIKP